MRPWTWAALVLGIGFAIGVPARADPRNDSTTALVQGEYQEAIDAADRGLAKDPRDPWLRYNKGSALAALGQVEVAIAELRLAERLFADVHWRSLAIYRIAVAHQDAKRCPEAQRAFAAYARLVADREPESAEIARRESETCGKAPGAERREVSGTDR
jgi:predicted Zn-dependent protease